MQELKLWYGTQHNTKGTHYNQFVSMSREDADNAIKAIKEEGSKPYALTETGTIDGSKMMYTTYMRTPIKQEGKYIFLNLTQTAFLGLPSRNTAIFVK